MEEPDEIDEATIDQPQKKKRKDELILEVLPYYVEEVKEACIKRNYPLIEEYDFKRDTRSPDLKIELKSST